MTATPVLDPAHALAQLDQDMPFNARMQQLITLSRQRHANTFDLIQWPETIEQAQWWLPPELLSVHGTAFGQSLSELQLMQLSKWECINAFSLNGLQRFQDCYNISWSDTSENIVGGKYAQFN